MIFCIYLNTFGYFVRNKQDFGGHEQENLASSIKKSMELHSFTRMEGRISSHPQISSTKVWDREMEKNSLIKMFARKIDRTNLHANTKITWPTVPRRIHGIKIRSLSYLQGQYVEDRSNKKK
jgi:hypothetical protein